MDDQEPQFLEVGEGAKRRRIAFRLGSGSGKVALLWLSGFLSDMAGTKASAIAAWAIAKGLPMLRFDYSGHGLSGGKLAQASIGDWLEVYNQPSAYAEPYPITKHPIEEGRAHLLEGYGFDPGCPVRILQGMCDADVPWSHALSLVELLTGNDVELALIKDGEHRLARREDIARLETATAALAERAEARDDQTP